MKKQLFALLLGVSMTLSALPATALAAGEGGRDTAPQYVLMNIPYDEFYAAELSGGNDVEVDGVTSATKSKPRTGTLVGGSYHNNSDGSDISGVTFPVKIGNGVDLSGFREITDNDHVEITITNRGQTSTTAYDGKDALFEKGGDHAYYVLSETPPFYKELTVKDGELSFGEVTGTETQTLSDASASLSPKSSYGDYQITVEGFAPEKVYGVVLGTTDNASYGLRHLENIWRNTNLAFSTGFTTSSHGSPISSAHYESIMGKTINKITYFTDGGVYEIGADVYVPVKAYETVPATVDGTEKQVEALKITEKDGSSTYDLSALDVKDTSVFANGENDAYLVTVGDDTQLIGGKSLSRWEGTWESWEPYIDQDGTASERYPYLDQVWQLAYEAYMAAFQAAGVDMSATMPDVSALKAYWGRLATTKGVNRIEIAPSGRNYAIKWLDADGNELGNGTYTMTGKMLKGFEGAPAYVFTGDKDVPAAYKYFIAMEPGMDGTEETPIAEHYHFQFGSDLDEMLIRGELHNSTDYGKNETTGRPISSNLKNSQWYATVIDADAEDLAKYNVILGMHRADKWSALPEQRTLTVTYYDADGAKISEKSYSSLETGKVSLEASAKGWALSKGGAKAYDGQAVLTDEMFSALYGSTGSVNLYLVSSGTGGTGGSSGGSGGGSSRPSVRPSTAAQDVPSVTTTPDAVPDGTSGNVSGFSDVAPGAYYHNAVAWAVENGITSGISDSRFGPDNACTRAQIITFLWRAAGSPAPSASHAFADVDSGAYYADAVAWAVEQGITTGTAAGAFSPDGTVTRAQTITFLYQFAGSPETSAENPFLDVTDSDYYAAAVQWAVAQGVTSGVSASSFAPADQCTRAQVVTFLFRQVAEQ